MIRLAPLTDLDDAAPSVKRILALLRASADMAVDNLGKIAALDPLANPRLAATILRACELLIGYTLATPGTLKLLRENSAAASAARVASGKVREALADGQKVGTDELMEIVKLSEHPFGD